MWLWVRGKCSLTVKFIEKVLSKYWEIIYVIPTQVYANVQNVRYRYVLYTYKNILCLIKTCKEHQWTSQKTVCNIFNMKNFKC